MNAFGFVLTEKQVVPSATVDDIDFGAVGAFMRAQGLDTEQAPQPARDDDLRYAITGSQILLEVFDDRITVTSPGALPNHMTVEQARMEGAPRSRNEMMANAMVVRGLMERRGRGWLTMRHAMRRFNGTEPALVNDERNRFVRVTFLLEPDSTGDGA